MPKVTGKTPVADKIIGKLTADPNWVKETDGLDSLRFAVQDSQRSTDLLVDAVDCLTSSVEKGFETLSSDLNDNFEKLMTLLEKVLTKEDA